MSLEVDYQIRWKNYRAFEDTDWITIKPLTILLGPNNSGKTSVISPLLMMSQTFSSLDAIAPMVTRGPLTDTGNFKDFVHMHDTSRDVFLGFRFHTHELTRKPKPLGAYPPGSVELVLSKSNDQGDMVLRRFELLDIANRSLFSQTRTKRGRYTFNSPVLKGFTPTELDAVKGNRPVNFLMTPTRALVGTKPRDNKTIRSKYSIPFTMYFSALGIVEDALRYFFNYLTYIGPLRDRAKRTYEIAGEMPVSIGLHGEHMANIVRKRLTELRPRLNEWVRRFEFGSQLSSKDISDEFFCLSFERNRSKDRINIADAGFGASQVLPLIVQALTAREKSLTIAEQPEIHLNPKLQYELADLFAEMANHDRRVIVETHSEHLLLRLRRLIAMGKIDCSKVALYFVEMSNGVSTVRNISIQRNGHIPNESWPKGFFEDSLRESISLATVQSERRLELKVSGKKENKEKCS
jgi:predicted ATPase